MSDIPEGIREKACEVCKEYIGGVWKTISPEDIIIHRFTGGFLNLTVKLSLPPQFLPIGNEPTEVVMKNACDLLSQGFLQRLTENVIVVLLAERKLAPKVYGIFDGGRLDEYIVSKPATPNDLRNPIIISSIARLLARMHACSFPISKNPNKFITMTEGVIQNFINYPINKENAKKEHVWQKIIAIDLKKEIDWILKLKDSVNSPVVYCHGDLQLNNILIKKDPSEEPVQIIDLDLCGYNYRGHDFANIYTSFCFDLTSSEPPFFRCDWDQYPSLEEQKSFIKTYLTEFQNQVDYSLDFANEEKRLLREYKVFEMIFILFATTFCFLRDDTKQLETKIDWIALSDALYLRYVDIKNKWIAEQTEK